jgi:hypothetical protein
MSEERRVLIRKAIRSFSLVLCSELLEILLEERKRRVKKLWVRDWMRRSLGALVTVLRELYIHDPQEYKAAMRITPNQFDELLCLIAPRIQRSDTMMREAVPARVKLEIILSFIGSATNYRMLSIFFRISKACISKIVPEVCYAI